MTMPGFIAEGSLRARKDPHPARAGIADMDPTARIVPAVPMVYCKYVCKWRVCGSSLPGYPPPMCYSCEQECWIHDSGPYSLSMWAQAT